MILVHRSQTAMPPHIHSSQLAAELVVNVVNARFVHMCRLLQREKEAKALAEEEAEAPSGLDWTEGCMEQVQV